MHFKTQASVISSFLERVNSLYEKSPDDFDKNREFTLKTKLSSNKKGRLELKTESLFYHLKEEHPCKIRKKGEVTFKFNAAQVSWLKNSTKPNDRIEFELLPGQNEAILTTAWGQMVFYSHRQNDSAHIDFSKAKEIMVVDREKFQTSIRAFRGLSFVRMRCDEEENRINAMPQDTGISGMSKIPAQEVSKDTVLWFPVGVMNAGMDMFEESNEITMSTVRVKRPSTDDVDEWVIFEGDDQFRFAMNSNITKTLSAEEYQNGIFDVVKNGGPVERFALMGAMLRNNVSSFIKGINQDSLEYEKIEGVINPDMKKGSSLATKTLSKNDDFSGFMKLTKLGCSVEIPLTFCSFKKKTNIKLPLNRLIGFMSAMPDAKNYLFTYYTEENTLLVEDDKSTACWVFSCDTKSSVDIEMEEEIKAKQA